MTTWWLESRSGVSRALGPAPLALGRASSCDVCLDSDQASRLHALVAVVAGVPTIVPVGRAGTLVDAQPVDRATPLRAGQRIEVPGGCFDLVGSVDPAPDWTVQGGDVIARVTGALTVGGGRRDGLRIPGLPDEAARFTAVGAGLVIEVETSATLDGLALEPGELAHARGDQSLVVGGHTLRVRSSEVPDAPTELTDALRLPRKAVFTFEPNGGRLEVTIGPDRTELQLSELRARLVASLLAPPRGLAPGAAVPDEQLVPMIWPGEARGRLDINQLVHRTRKDFLAVGLDGLEILHRGGGGTAFLLAPGAAVEIR